MSLDRDLDRWTAAGLLDSRTAAAIRAFEAARQPHDPRRVVWISASLAGLAIALGIVAVLAANWDAIPGAAKIVADLALLGGLAIGLSRIRTHGPAWAFEAALLAFVGLVLASLGLVVQQTQIDVHFSWMSLLWIALVAPAWLHARASFTHGVFVVALSVTWFALLGELPQDGAWSGSLTALLAMSTPLILLVAGQFAATRGHTTFAGVASLAGWFGLALAASFGTMAFYGGRPFPWDDPDMTAWLWGWAAGTAWVVSLTALAALAAWAPADARSHAAHEPEDNATTSRGAPLDPSDPAVRARRGLLVVSAACIVLPLPLTPGEALPALAALTFLAYWVWLGRVVVRIGRPALLDGVAVVIGVRLLVAYAEVFGSLLDTGLALIGGGLLALLLLLVWVRRREAIAGGVASSADRALSNPEGDTR